MKVLIVEPGKYPREADIEHTLEAEQAVVGGTISGRKTKRKNHKRSKAA